jgi:hypothetical protein
MKNKFYCQNCIIFFEAEGGKIEFQDPIYGRCWKRVAPCPTCNKECNEQNQKSTSSKKSVDFDTYVSELKNRNSGGCCGGGGCCG